MTPISLFVVATLVFAICMLLLTIEINRLQARMKRLERRLENAHVSVATHLGPNPHTHTAVVSFPNHPRGHR